MKRAFLFVFVALIGVTAATAQETVKDRKSFIPNRKQAAVGGAAVGILLTDGQPILSTEGRSGPADQLVFSSGGNSYRWVYVPTQDKPMITNLQVPVGDKGEKTVYAALNLANPPSMLAWAIKTPYTLVEVEVNSGRGSPAGDSFVGTNFKVLEGSADFPLKVADVVKQVKDRYAEHVSKQKDAIDAAMKDHGDKALAGKQPTGPREKKDLMFLTWLPESSTMRVHFKTTISDGSYQFVGGPNGKDPPVLPPIKKKIGVLPPRVAPPNFAAKVGTTFGIEFGMAYIVNKKGEVVGTESLPIETFTQQLNAPPNIGPRPVLPLPVPLPPIKN
jgi:hypothetical protein